MKAKFSIHHLQRLYGDDVRQKLGAALLHADGDSVEVDTMHPEYRALKPIPRPPSSEHGDPAKEHAMQAIREAGSITRKCCGQ